MYRKSSQIMTFATANTTDKMRTHANTDRIDRATNETRCSAL